MDKAISYELLLISTIASPCRSRSIASGKAIAISTLDRRSQLLGLGTGGFMMSNTAQEIYVHEIGVG